MSHGQKGHGALPEWIEPARRDLAHGGRFRKRRPFCPRGGIEQGQPPLYPTHMNDVRKRVAPFREKPNRHPHPIASARAIMPQGARLAELTAATSDNQGTTLSSAKGERRADSIDREKWLGRQEAKSGPH